jgi:hypothetical protein
MSDWIETAAERIVHKMNVTRNIPYLVNGRDYLSAMDAVRAMIEDAYAASEQREYCQPGGCAYGKCEKHEVPLVHTITEQTYCAVCVEAERRRLEQQLAAANARVAAMPAPHQLRLAASKTTEFFTSRALYEMAGRIEAAAILAAEAAQEEAN